MNIGMSIISLPSSVFRSDADNIDSLHFSDWIVIVTAACAAGWTVGKAFNAQVKLLTGRKGIAVIIVFVTSALAVSAGFFLRNELLLWAANRVQTGLVQPGGFFRLYLVPLAGTAKFITSLLLSVTAAIIFAEFDAR